MPGYRSAVCGGQIIMEFADVTTETGIEKTKENRESGNIRLLITGENSYIGKSFSRYIQTNHIPDIEISFLSVRTSEWKNTDLTQYDAVLHTASIVHTKETKENRAQFYAVNRDLAIEFAAAAKKAGVKHFLLMSSMSVYGKSTGHIRKGDEPKPVSAYGDSKLQADVSVMAMQDDAFRVAVIRPPMVYGSGCKGNYTRLRKLVLHTPVFPKINNKRSMIYVDNLCAFIKDILTDRKTGIFHPQNMEYVSTSEMARYIAVCGKKHVLFPAGIFSFVKYIPLNIFEKTFGDLTYEKEDLVGTVGFEESMKLTENYFNNNK